MDSKLSSSERVPLLFSTRFGLAVIACLGFINLYALRVDMSVAIVCMVNKSAEISNKGNNTERAELERSCGVENTTSELGDGEFLWDKKLQGLILGSFFWGYILTQIPGGLLAGKFGGKHVFGWSMLVCAVVTLLTPVCARASPYLLLACRFVAGLAQGVVWPSMWTMWASWAPPLERSRLMSVCTAGSQLGNVITFPVAGLLCDYGFDGGWPSIFYILGGIGILWFLLWQFLTTETPAQHPRISEREKVYIETSLRGQGVTETERKKFRPPLRSIVTSLPVWAIVVAHACNNWGGYTMLTNIPTYLREVLFFDIKSNGLISALPYIAYWLMIVLGGHLADCLRSRRGVSTTVVRRLFNATGMISAAAFTVAVAFMTCDKKYVAVAFLVMGLGFCGLTSASGYVVNHVDIAPRYAGLLFGISNTMASAPGFLAPLTVGHLTPNQSQEEWQKVFFICAAIYVFGAVFFLVFASGELQDWAEGDEDVQDGDRDQEMALVKRKD